MRSTGLRWKHCAFSRRPDCDYADFQRDALQTAAGAENWNPFPPLPIQIEGAVVAATFKEAEPGQYKVSLRTNGLLDGGKICALFGGGGHRMAAGCSMRGAYETLEACMVKTLRQELEKVQ